MALIKNENLANGVSINYWKVYKIDLASNGTEVLVAGYLDKATRDANKNPVEGKGFALPALQLADLDLLDNNPYKLVYELLKNEPFFDGATNG